MQTNGVLVSSKEEEEWNDDHENLSRAYSKHSCMNNQCAKALNHAWLDFGMHSCQNAYKMLLLDLSLYTISRHL